MRKRNGVTRAMTKTRKLKSHGERMQAGKPYMIISQSGLVFHAKLYSVGRNGTRKVVVFTNVR